MADTALRQTWLASPSPAKFHMFSVIEFCLRRLSKVDIELVHREPTLERVHCMLLWIQSVENVKIIVM